jgi:hypothetical protein
MKEIVINNLTYDHIHSLLAKEYDNPQYCKEYSERIVREKKFECEGTFKNGNRLIGMERSGSIFGVLTPEGDLIKLFFIYDCEHVSYRQKHDVFMISAHETLTEVSSDGSLEQEYTR